jgi:hypothetical protein
LRARLPNGVVFDLRELDLRHALVARALWEKAPTS